LWQYNTEVVLSTVPPVQTSNTAAEIELELFLRRETKEDTTELPRLLVENESTGLWIHIFERNEHSGWTPEQVCTTLYAEF
jgi:hypothetical protein